ncbi:TrmH family RNA methyltransferase [Candidatus Peregrinibacteria bacterium]|nr:TrmH family RNA methyltransferase [Candidatus Peregrinibacteria bacterium]
MRKLCHAEIQKIKPSVSEVKKKKRNPIYAVIDNVRSLYNVGAIFRTSDAVLLKKLYLCGITGFPPRKEISKTALGAEETVPWEHYDDSLEVIKKLKKNGVKIAAVELTDENIRYDKAEYKFPVCFVFGHEVEGISDDVIQFVDFAVYLPMSGRANSLNVATCYGIIMYEALKKIKK